MEDSTDQQILLIQFPLASIFMPSLLHPVYNMQSSLNIHIPSSLLQLSFSTFIYLLPFSSSLSLLSYFSHTLSNFLSACLTWFLSLLPFNSIGRPWQSQPGTNLTFRPCKIWYLGIEQRGIIKCCICGVSAQPHEWGINQVDKLKVQHHENTCNRLARNHMPY